MKKVVFGIFAIVVFFLPTWFSFSSSNIFIPPVFINSGVVDSMDMNGANNNTDLSSMSGMAHCAAQGGGSVMFVGFPLAWFMINMPECDEHSWRVSFVGLALSSVIIFAYWFIIIRTRKITTSQ